ncbi:unnamed protein product [Durusdinium trenchii]|uniref:Oxidation resistance protein 1 n=1 Tax=Durusdinium trenchii TaxID=1381693 RepID=A0ABP0KA28_9DINO
MQHILRAKSRPRRPRTPTSSSLSPKSSRHEPQQPQDGPLRLQALYCTPHIKVPGKLFVSPLLVTFVPDPDDKHVQEFGGELYTVTLEVQDLLQCGGITMPQEDGTDLAYFLQMEVRTLNGQIFRTPEDQQDPWFLVFRLLDKEDLRHATALLLEAKQAHPGHHAGWTQTSVPFPCLDCMAELEHAVHHHQLQQQLDKKKDRSSSSSAARLMGSFANFLSGPRDSKAADAQGPSPAKPSEVVEEAGCHVDKVVFQLPENCQRSVLNKDLAEALLDYLPVGLRLPGLVQWVLRYTPKAHGVSLATMFRNLAERKKTIIIIQDTEDYIFGGFATSAWEPCGRFYGSGEAFVFSFGKASTSEVALVQFFPWSSVNECCMYADHSLFGMGGGEGRHAFVVQADLLQGHSSPTPTFKNSILAATEEFVVRDIEVLLS